MYTRLSSFIDKRLLVNKSRNMDAYTECDSTINIDNNIKEWDLLKFT